MSDRASMVIRIAANIDQLKKTLGDAGQLIQMNTKSMEKMAASLRGDQLQAAALKATAGIQALGGATKLTAAEAARYEQLLGKALEKARAMGQTAPADMLKTHAALKQVADQAAIAEPKVGALQSAFARMAGAFSVGLLVDRGISSLINFGKEALRSAGEIKDLSLRLGVSTDAVQEWTFAATQSGATMDDVSRAVTQMNDSLATGNASTVASLKLAGLEFAALRAMKPEAAFNAIVEAIKSIDDPMLQTRVAMDAFGKGGAEMLAAIKAGMAEQIKLAPKMSEATIEGLDEASDEWDRFLNQLTVWTGSAIGKMRTMWESFGGLNMGRTALLTALKPLGIGYAGEMPTTQRAVLPSVLIGSLPDLDAAMKAGEELTKQVLDKIAKVEKARADAAKAEKDYQDWKRAELTGITPQIQKALDYEVRLLREGVSLLRIKTSATDDLMRAQKRLISALPPPPLFNQLGDASGSIGSLLTPGMLGMNQPDSRFGQERAAERLMVYNGLLDLASQTMGQLAQTAKAGWRETTQAIQIAIQAVQNFANGMSAAATASSAAFALIAMAIQIGIRNYQREQAAIENVNAELRRLGLSAQEVRDLMATLGVTPGINGLTAVLQYWQTVLRIAVTHFDDLTEAAQRYGQRAPAALQPMIARLLETNRLTDEQRRLLESLQGEHSWEALQEAAERYGIAIEDLGSRFQQNRISAAFDDILRDFTMLTEGGADAEVVLRGMADEVMALLDNARRFGTALPEFMRPILQQMNALGLLGDIDLSQFRFDPSIESSIDRMATAIERLVDLLARDLPHAAEWASRGVVESFRKMASAVNDGNKAGAPEGSFGGYGGSGAGSFVMKPTGGGVAVQGGDAPITIQVNTYLDGQKVAEVITPYIPRIARSYGVS